MGESAIGALAGDVISVLILVVLPLNVKVVDRSKGTGVDEEPRMSKRDQLLYGGLR